LGLNFDGKIYYEKRLVKSRVLKSGKEAPEVTGRKLVESLSWRFAKRKGMMSRDSRLWDYNLEKLLEKCHELWRLLGK